MKMREKGRFEDCERFRDELETLPLPECQRFDCHGLLVKMNAEIRGHAEVCEGCMAAVDDLVETRNLLLSWTNDAMVAQPGPWFASKVMNAIAAKEMQMEQSEGVWQSVRRLAPRLAAVCALLLMLAGTWAIQVRRNFEARQMAAPGENLFEPTPSAALNDDVLLSVEAHR